MHVQNRTFNTMFLQILGICIVWYLSFNLNEIVFAFTKVIPGVNLIFLPSMLRVATVLLFGWTAAVGMGLGTFILIAERFNDPAWARTELQIVLTILADIIGPILAVFIGTRIMSIKNTLAGLSTVHIFAFAILGAVCNSILHRFSYYAGDAAVPAFFDSTVPMFTGDMMGAVLMLYTLSMSLRGWESFKK